MNISKPRLLIFIVAYFAEHTIEKVGPPYSCGSE